MKFSVGDRVRYKDEDYWVMRTWPGASRVACVRVNRRVGDVPLNLSEELLTMVKKGLREGDEVFWPDPNNEPFGIIGTVKYLEDHTTVKWEYEWASDMNGISLMACVLKPRSELHKIESSNREHFEQFNIPHDAERREAAEKQKEEPSLEVAPVGTAVTASNWEDTMKPSINVGDIIQYANSASLFADQGDLFLFCGMEGTLAKCDPLDDPQPGDRYKFYHPNYLRLYAKVGTPKHVAAATKAIQERERNRPTLLAGDPDKEVLLEIGKTYKLTHDDGHCSIKAHQAFQVIRYEEWSCSDEEMKKYYWVAVSEGLPRRVARPLYPRDLVGGGPVPAEEDAGPSQEEIDAHPGEVWNPVDRTWSWGFTNTGE